MRTTIRPFTPAALCAVIVLALLTACSDSQETPQAPQAPTTAPASPVTAAPDRGGINACGNLNAHTGTNNHPD